MLLTEMKLGKSLEIIVLRGEYKFRLVSKVEDVRKGRVSVTLIASKNRVFRFDDADDISLIYKDENRLWKWKGVIGGTVELEGCQLHCFFTDKKGESFNRRNSYRVFIGEDMKLLYNQDTNETKEEDQSEDIVCEGFLKDLSESGAGIFSDERFALHDEISFTVYSDCGPLKCKAEVVRISQETHGIYKRYYGCNFTESDRNLTKYLFKLQRQALLNARKDEKR